MEKQKQTWGALGCIFSASSNQRLGFQPRRLQCNDSRTQSPDSMKYIDTRLDTGTEVLAADFSKNSAEIEAERGSYLLQPCSSVWPQFYLSSL
jgi:hypothetical protein